MTCNAGPISPRRTLAAFAFLLVTQLVATLDNQIVSTALPTIVGDLGEAQHYGWLLSGYLLAQCMVMPIYGKLGDLFGRKYVLIVAHAIFLLGTIGCAASWSMTSLILARFVQGLGTGGLLISVYAICADLFEPSRRARFQSYLSFVFVFGSFFGPTLGGILTDTLGWRSIFLVTVPLICGAMAGILRFVPLRRNGRQPRIDYAGALLLSGTVAVLLILVDSRRLYGSFLSRESLSLAALAMVLAITCTLIERRAAEPVLPLQLFRSRNFLLLSLTTLFFGAISIGLVSYYAYFAQMVMGLSPSHTGLVFVAITIGVSAGALSAGWLMSRRNDVVMPIRASFALSVVTLGALGMLPPAASTAMLMSVLALQGFATGLAINAVVLHAQQSADDADVGTATGTISLIRTIGGATGIAIYGSIIAMQLTRISQRTGVSAEALTPAALRSMPKAQSSMIIAGYGDGFAALFQTATAIAVTGLIIALLLRPPVRP